MSVFRWKKVGLLARGTEHSSSTSKFLHIRRFDNNVQFSKALVVISYVKSGL